MKCLSVRQPFAWAIIKGIKKVENRADNFPDHRGPVLIHAAKTVAKVTGKFPDGTPVPDPKVLPLGAVVGAAIIAEMCPIGTVEGVASGEYTITEDETRTWVKAPWDTVGFPRVPDYEKKIRLMAADPFTQGPLCILLASPIAFATPVPWKGQVGLFNVDETKLGLQADDWASLQELLARGN